MRKVPLLTAAFITVSGTAFAASDDTTVEACSPMKRTTIIGVVGEPTTIKFTDGAGIYRIAQTNKYDKATETMKEVGWVGPSPAEVKEKPLENVVPLWPAEVGTTTMTIITKVDEKAPQVVYPFLMVAITAEEATKLDKPVMFSVVCSGKAAIKPPAPAVAAPAVKVVAAPKRPDQDALLKLRTDAFDRADDACHYHATGPVASPITPKCPMDNGEWTLIRFPGLTHKPALYVVTGKNDERLARQHASGEFVVVEEIAAHFRERLGDDVLDIINDAYTPAGKPAGTGTISPTVTRELLQAKVTR
jgi:type IV secretory pathway VirB9-like protein